MIDVRLEGQEALNDILDDADGVAHLRPPMERATLRLQADMAKYPRQRSGAKNRRTGELGRRWTRRISTVGGGIDGWVGNNASYGPYVQSAQRQAWMHRGVWQTDEDVLNRHRAEIVADFERAIQGALRG